MNLYTRAMRPAATLAASGVLTAAAHAREHQDAQFAATLHERQRLARELHDTVTQTLPAAGLNARVLPRVCQSDQEEGARCLAELQRLTWGALAEHRGHSARHLGAALSTPPFPLRRRCSATV